MIVPQSSTISRTGRNQVHKTNPFNRVETLMVIGSSNRLHMAVTDYGR